MPYSLQDLAAVEKQIATMRTSAKLGDMSVSYDVLENQLKVREMIIIDLQSQGIQAVPTQVRVRSWNVNTCKGL